MFKNSFNFIYKRSFKEAFGFYLIHLLTILLIGFLLGSLLFIVTENSYELIIRIGILSAVIYCLVICTLILIKKKISNIYLILILLTGILTIYGGAIIGLIPSVYLSTLDSNEIIEKDNEIIHKF